MKVEVFAFRPDLSFFINGIFPGYAELKSNFTNQTARVNGRNKVTTDYLEAVWEYTKVANGNDVSQTLRRRMLRPFEKSIHLVSTDINSTFILRNPSQFFDEAKHGFQKSTISISSFRLMKDLRHNGEWVYDKILLVVDRLQLRDQLDYMMLNMNIDKAMFVEATDQDTFVKVLSDKRRIIVVNIQKFWELKKAIEKAGEDFTGKRVAFLIDEIHRSNTDDVHQEMFSAFDQLQDIFDEDGGFLTRGSTKKNLFAYGYIHR